MTPIRMKALSAKRVLEVEAATTEPKGGLGKVRILIREVTDIGKKGETHRSDHS